MGARDELVLVLVLVLDEPVAGELVLEVMGVEPGRRSSLGSDLSVQRCVQKRA